MRRRVCIRSEHRDRTRLPTRRRDRVLMHESVVRVIKVKIQSLYVENKFEVVAKVLIRTRYILILLWLNDRQA